MSKTYFDICVVIPLAEELREFWKVFPSKRNLTENGFLVHEVESGTPGLTVVVVNQKEMGSAAACDATRYMLDRYDVGLVAVCGIAGALSSDLKLGDVCISTSVIDVYENTKVTDDPNSSRSIVQQFSPVFFQTPESIRTALGFFSTQPELEDEFQDWRDTMSAIVREICPHPVIGRKGEEQLSAPLAYSLPVVCGAVSKSQNYNDKLRDIDRKVGVIETESGGVFKAAAEKGVSAVSIRGVSDYADANKNKLEASSQGLVRPIAAASAFQYLRRQARNPYFIHQLERLRPSSQPSLPYLENAGIKEKVALFEELRELIDQRLRDYSPEYRLHPKGYRVPAPRVKRQEVYDSPAGGSKQSDPLEISDALGRDSKILLHVPRSYPDKSLPWVIAQQLLNSELGGEQLFPIVIDGSKIAKPNKGFNKLSDVDLDAVKQLDGIRVVFIVEETPLSSPSRRSMIEEEVKIHSDSLFLFFSSSQLSIMGESELKLSLSLKVYSLCNVSFLQITNFIQHAFDLESSAAEVVAGKLWRTFEAFDLSAHPSYFAGIPLQMLTALLEANKRAELLQLAVDGFLSLVVAGDEDSVPLSRRTRTLFLSDLVEIIHVEKRNLSHEDVISLVKNIAVDKDFDIDPISYVSSFVNSGILNFDNDSCAFSLAFMEQYLLAQRLADNPDAAKSYFSFQDFDFNPHVLDIYSEINPDSSIKERIQQKIDDAIERLSSIKRNKNIMLTNDINPRIISSANRVDALKKRLSQAVNDVRADRSAAESKQRFLDVSEKVKDSTDRHIRIEYERSIADEEKELDFALNSFMSGVLLMGSGAEHLNASEKRNLALKLTSLGSSIVDIWTGHRAAIKFDSFREELLRDRLGIPLEELSVGEDEFKQIVNGLVDMIEGALLSDPFRQVITLLCEHARSKVLAKSLKNAIPDEEFAQLLHALWLGDVDPSAGVDDLKAKEKVLGKLPFLRMCVAMHCMSRVYWSHWKKADRLKILDVADSFLKPVSIRVTNKAAIKREIEKNADRGE